MVKKKEVGTVTHFFTNISVAAIKLKAPLKVGDTISIEGTTTNFQQKVDSMQVDKQSLAEAKAKQEIGIKVSDKVREGDVVYKLEE